jgi:HPt (histidine-containing phosphotransfer) domain-containing protein
MDAFLTKPIRPSEVLDVLAKCRRATSDDASDDMVARSVFNAQRLIDICDGDQDFLAEIIDEFERSSDDLITELDAHVADGDLEAIRQVAHKLKGSSRNIGGDKLAAVCEELELCSKNGVNAGLNEILERIRGALSDLKLKLKVVGTSRLSEAA